MGIVGACACSFLVVGIRLYRGFFMLEDEGCTWLPNDNDKLALSSEHFLCIKAVILSKTKNKQQKKNPSQLLGRTVHPLWDCSRQCMIVKVLEDPQPLCPPSMVTAMFQSHDSSTPILLLKDPAENAFAKCRHVLSNAEAPSHAYPWGTCKEASLNWDALWV